MAVLERLAAGLSASAQITPDHERLLALHLLDTLGAWLAGGATVEGQMLARFAALDPIARRVATVRLTEIDDIDRASCTTPSAIVVPVALSLALAAERPMPASLFARALMAGYEATTRFGVAVAGPKILSRGLWPSYVAAPLGAAATAAVLMGLDEGGVADALAIALTLLSGGAGGHGAPSPRWWLLGHAAQAGLRAAQAAAAGYAGDRSLLDGDWLARVHGIALDPAPLLTAGEPAIARLSLKPYCAAKQTIAAIDAFRDLLDRGLKPAEIARLRIAVPPAYAAMIGHGRAGESRVGRITSVAYQLALAAYRRDGMGDVTRADLTGDPRIADLMARCEVVADESLAGHYPQSWPARVEAVDGRGETCSALVLEARGDPANPLDAAAVQEKFHELSDPVIGRSLAERLAVLSLVATSHDEGLTALCAEIAQMPERF